MNIVLYPLDKVDLNGKIISLGMEQEAVERLIGSGKVTYRNLHYYFNAEMAIDYDASGKVEFIEFLGGIDGKLKPVIYGVSAFDVDAEELAELLRRENHGAVDDSERGYSYAFLNISVGVYRPLIPARVLEMEEEMRREGVPTEGNADLEQDRRRATHWTTIGIGVAGYYG